MFSVARPSARFLLICLVMVLASGLVWPTAKAEAATAIVDAGGPGSQYLVAQGGEPFKILWTLPDGCSNPAVYAMFLDFEAATFRRIQTAIVGDKIQKVFPDSLESGQYHFAVAAECPTTTAVYLLRLWVNPDLSSFGRVSPHISFGSTWDEGLSSAERTAAPDTAFHFSKLAVACEAGMYETDCPDSSYVKFYMFGDPALLGVSGSYGWFDIQGTKNRVLEKEFMWAYYSTRQFPSGLPAGDYHFVAITHRVYENPGWDATHWAEMSGYVHLTVG